MKADVLKHLRIQFQDFSVKLINVFVQIKIIMIEQEYNAANANPPKVHKKLDM